MYSAVAWVFIAGAAGTATYLWERPTVARGDLLVKDVAGISAFSSMEGLTCDDAVIGVDGGEFGCEGRNAYREREHLDCTLDRDGALRCRPAAHKR